MKHFDKINDVLTIKKVLNIALIVKTTMSMIDLVTSVCFRY